MKMWEILPPDLWIEILVRLPVHTLLTLKCVSKWLLSIIQTTTFAKLHFSRFNNSYSDSDHSHHLLLIERVSTLERVVCRGNSCTKTCLFPIKVYQCWEDVVGYAEGLFWLHRFWVPWESSTGIICNPSLGKSFHVPPCPNVREISFYNKEGFGYDPLTDDYKAVVIVLQNDVFTEVFSLRRGSWRSLAPNAISKDWISRMRGIQHVYANGSIHWPSPGHRSDENYEFHGLGEFTHVVSFDLGNEVFRFRELPKQVEDFDPYEKAVKLPMSYQGCFAVCYISKFHICVWVMMEDGWVKQWLIDSSHDFYCYLSKLYYDNKLLFRSAILSENTGELLIAWVEKGVISYNLSTQQHQLFHERVTRMFMNVDSLRWKELLPNDTT